ncbi:MAG: outer membrane beta-barrel domain-containing protein [Bdellovibrionota bacterium]
MIVNILLTALFWVVVFCGLDSSAEQTSDIVAVPKDELAQESVYPVFDNPVSVKSRNVQDTQTFDVGLFSGLAISEPIASTSKFGVSLGYHFNETHSLGVLWAVNSNGLSKDAEGLKSDFGLDFTRAPFPQYSIIGDYNYKLFYGKLSVTKDGVINTSIYASAAAGLIKYVHKTYPTVAIGVGERFYFTSNIAFKVDLRLFIGNAPIPFKTGALRAVDPVPTYDSFAERLTYTTNLEFGVNYIF